MGTGPVFAPPKDGTSGGAFDALSSLGSGVSCSWAGELLGIVEFGLTEHGTAGPGGECGWAIHGNLGDGSEFQQHGLERSAGTGADVRVELWGQLDGDRGFADPYLCGSRDVYGDADGNGHEQFEYDGDEQSDDRGACPEGARA